MYISKILLVPLLQKPTAFCKTNRWAPQTRNTAVRRSKRHSTWKQRQRSTCFLVDGDWIKTIFDTLSGCNCNCTGGINCNFVKFFSECVARVPVSRWGSGGKAVFAKCCVCARNRSSPFATVLNRLRDRRKARQARMHLEWSRKCVKLTRDAAVILASSKSVLPVESYKGVILEAKGKLKVSYKRAKKVCQARVSYKSVRSECPTRVSSQSVLQECQGKAPYKSVK